MKKLLDLYKKYKEIINYLIFGVLSTIVNFGVYFIATRCLKLDEVVSSGIGWFFAVLFAYITNKIYVFESKTETKKELLKEVINFFGARIFSGIVCNIGTMYLLVKVFKVNDIISQLIVQVLVVILNYVLSKVIVFKKKNDEKSK